MNVTICPKHRPLRDFLIGTVVSSSPYDAYIKIRDNPRGFTDIFRLKTSFTDAQSIGYDHSSSLAYYEVGAEIIIKLDGSEKVINHFSELKEGDVFVIATESPVHLYVPYHNCYLVISPEEVFNLYTKTISKISSFVFSGQNLIKVNHELKIFSK